jgi:hypothetical protein
MTDGTLSDVAADGDRIAALCEVIAGELRELWGEERRDALADRVRELARNIALVEHHATDSLRTDLFRPDHD